MHLTPVFAETGNHFLPLLLVVLLAFLVPIILARFQRIPVVVGEILAGILVGPSLLGIVSNDAILSFMANIGLAFLIFLAGMEIDLAELFPRRNGSSLKRVGPNLLLIALGLYLLTVGLAVPGGWLISRIGGAGDPWLIALVLSAASLGVLLPLLKERRLLPTFFGQVIFLTAILADFLTVLLLTIYIILLEQGLNLEIFSVGLLFLAFLIVFQVGPNVVGLPRVRSFFDELSRATVQLKVRGAIAILMSFVVLAEFVGAELILGAFLAGMIVTLLRAPDDDVLVEKLEAFGFGFFVPVFFIMVGAQINLRDLLESPQTLLLLPLLFVVALVVKVLPMLVTRRWLSWRELLSAGLLLNTHLSLEVAIAVVGLRTGLLDSAASTTIILFAILTVLFMPVLFNTLMPETTQPRKRLIALIGVNDLGLKVAAELRNHGDDITFLENNQTQQARASNAGYAVISAPPNASGVEVLPAAQVETVLALHENDALNLAIARAAHSLQIANIVALVQDPAQLAAFQDLGVQPYVSAMHRATMLAMMARNPDTYTLLTSTNDQREISEVRLRNRSLEGMQLRDLHLPGDTLVLSIRRRSQLLIPHGNTALEFNDRLSLLGNISRLEEAKVLLERS
ncbi:MAG: cation:proton antiporter [Caldilineales bacterium]